MNFRLYGLLGLFTIIFAELVIFLKIFPFVFWFTPLVWFGYILLIDAIVYSLKGNSLLVNRKFRLFQMFILSAIFWWIFEFFNDYIRFQGWYYVNLPDPRYVALIMGTLSFSTIVPAVFETWELVKTFHLFKNIKTKIQIPHNKLIFNLLIVAGIIFLMLPFVITSAWMWAFVWIGFILLLDPILYLNGSEKSLIVQIKKKKYNTIISLIVAGYIAGFLWEFWNYWAYTKWFYTIPVLENIKVFEIPAVGFLAYGPFVLELYVMYHFVRFLLHTDVKPHLIKI